MLRSGADISAVIPPTKMVVEAVEVVKVILGVAVLAVAGGGVDAIAMHGQSELGILIGEGVVGQGSLGGDGLKGE